MQSLPTIGVKFKVSGKTGLYYSITGIHSISRSPKHFLCAPFDKSMKLST